MFHQKTKVDSRSSRRAVALLAVTLILILIAAPAMSQKTAGRKPRAGTARGTPKTSKKEDAKALDEAAKESRANLLSASKDYRASLEKLLELQRQEEARAAELVSKRKELLDLGVISKREFDDSERALLEIRSKISETMSRFAEVDQLVAEVNAAEELAKISAQRPGIHSSAGLVIRYVGASRWVLSDFAKVDAFFR
ncbi:MAG TPA: hypothetical protein VI479_18450, partial [Blastocatellia bacterium]